MELEIMIWAYTRHEAYTVKTGYEMLAKAKTMLAGPIYLEEQKRNALKNKIWKIPTLPKIQMFLWRAVSGALAVVERLKSRVASGIWSDAGIPLPAASMQQSLEENLRFAFNAMEDTTRSRTIKRSVPWILWLVWKNRNSILYAETQESTERLLRNMADEVDQWFKLNKVLIPDTNERAYLNSSDSWSPLEDGTIKCNIHANWRNASLHSGIAWIARDQSGNVIHHARDALVHDPNRLIAEFRCVIWAMMSLSDLGVINATIASDYNKVVEAIKSPLQWPHFRTLLQQITKFKEKFVSITFEGKRVQANGVARVIARSVLKDGRFQSYLALGGPSWLQDRLVRERNRSNI
ncbi:hypothetical protein Bca101_068546 [Brassica carinata]